MTTMPSIQRSNSKFLKRTRTRITIPATMNGYQSSHKTSANVG